MMKQPSGGPAAAENVTPALRACAFVPARSPRLLLTTAVALLKAILSRNLSSAGVIRFASQLIVVVFDHMDRLRELQANGHPDSR